MKLDDYRCEYCRADLSTSEALDRHDGAHAHFDPRATRSSVPRGKPFRTSRVDLLRFEMDDAGYVKRRVRGPFNPVRVLMSA
jgi:hypothetical protein